MTAAPPPGPLRVLVAGAAGALGREVVRTLKARGHVVTALVHRTALPVDLAGSVSERQADALNPGHLTDACKDIDVVCSCLGGSVLPEWGRGRRSFANLDAPANLNLLAASEATGVRRFVYVAVAGQDHLGGLRYVRAHEIVVKAARASPMTAAILRPAGFFSAFRVILSMARQGAVPIIGPGTARTNPIDERDLAIVCADAVEGLDDEEVEAGGPEIMTRREIVELAFRVQSLPPRTRTLAPALARALAPLMRPVNARMADLTAFYAAVSTRDLIVPAAGTRTLREYFVERSAPTG